MWAVLRFSGYKPQFVTIKNAARWLSQFDEKDRKIILQLLHNVIYISEKETASMLLEQNTSLIGRLNAKGIPPKQIIYVQVHDPGSSSAVMLKMLRDQGRLERKGYHFIDSKNVRELNELTAKLELGADNICGRFCRVR